MKAFVLAGGFPQISLLRELKRRGITTLLADYTEHPLAEKEADAFFRVSTLDVTAIRQLAEEEKVDFLITVCTDQALLTVARVSAELGLPTYLDYETALCVTNKCCMKKRLQEAGIPTARFVTSEHWQPELFQGMHFPVVVKPVDANSSKGVEKVNSFAVLEEKFCAAKAISRTSNVIVEEFCNGLEITVDAYIENGKAEVLAISQVDKVPVKGKFIIYRTVYPAPISRQAQATVQQIVQDIAEAFHLINSPLLVQMIVHGDAVSVVEFSARTGGGTKHIFLKLVSGFDAIQSVVDLTMGKHYHVEHRESPVHYIVEEYLYAHAGRLTEHAGADLLLQDGTIAEYYRFMPEGTELAGRVQSSGDRVAGFRLEAATADEIREKHRRALQGVKLLSDEGVDLMRRDLIEPLEIGGREH